MQFKKIGLMGTHRNPLVGQTVEQVAHILKKCGALVYVESESARGLKLNGALVMPLHALCQEIDLVIAVGGDGNLLHAARMMSLQGIPVIGINRGQLGFLTDLSPDDLALPLTDILKGDYVTEERFLLEGKVMRQDGSSFGEGNALNDVVLFPGDVAQLIEFEMRIDGQFVYSQRSDGLIIATPTGSTAYALSAGGPIIAPHLEAMVLVPKLPHTLTSRPVVIDAKSQIEIRLAEYNKTQPRLSYDGQSHVPLDPQDRILIYRQAKPLILLHPKNYNSYEIWREKLHWGRQLISLQSSLYVD
jgi:NAD+ kinase